MLVKALRRTRTLREVPMDLIERDKGESKAFRVKNFVDVLRTLRVLCAVQWGARCSTRRGPAAPPAEPPA